MQQHTQNALRTIIKGVLPCYYCSELTEFHSESLGQLEYTQSTLRTARDHENALRTQPIRSESLRMHSAPLKDHAKPRKTLSGITWNQSQRTKTSQNHSHSSTIHPEPLRTTHNAIEPPSYNSLRTTISTSNRSKSFRIHSKSTENALRTTQKHLESREPISKAPPPIPHPLTTQ
jgi:hypothetical protein